MEDEIAQYLAYADKVVSEIENKSEKIKAEARKQEILRSYTGDDAVVSFEETLERVKLQPPRQRIKSTHYSLDDDLGGGFKLGELVVIGGIQGNGKTAFCFDLSRRMEKYAPFWLPFEESAEEYAEKLIEWHANGHRFYHPMTMKSENFEWIAERILESVLKNGTKVVFVDNLHFITMGSSSDQMQHTLGNLTKKFKKLASKLNIVIILIVHLRKTGGGISKMPTMDDIHGSSDIAKVASTVLMLWRESTQGKDGRTNYTGDTVIGVQKCRAGAKQDNHTFTFNKGKFTDNGISVFVEPELYD